jgi:putative tryptophan/tyrosine transport system substrate-binding protein
MHRRHVLSALVLGGLAAPRLAAAQRSARPARIGVLLYGTPESDPNFAAFRDGMKDLGYVEGRTVTFDLRGAESKPERLPALAADLVKQEPQLIFALGGDVAPFARAATNTIPIVGSFSNDPVQTQLVASLGRPGGNVTGVTFVSSDLAAKRLQFLKEIAPAISRVGILWNPDHADPEYRETQVTSRQLGLQLTSLEVRRPADFDHAFAAAVAAKVEAVIVISSRLLQVSQAKVLESANRHKMALVTGWGPWVRNGALLSYGPDLDAAVRLAAAQVDKILKGAKPADIPVEQPTKFLLAINTRTAKTFGLTVPPSLLLRADQIIE